MKPIHYIAIGCILATLLGCAFALGRVTAPKSEAGTSKRDTVDKIVPIFKDFPQPLKTASIGFVGIPKYKFITDTLRETAFIDIHDTTFVYLPREQRYYAEEEGRLRLWVSGYDPKVDRYEIDWIETTITETITPKPKRWGIGISAGYGAAMAADKTVVFSPFIGIGIQYNFLSW